MNIKFIITVAILIGSFNANAQTSISDNERIDEIKKWYAEIQSLGLINCKAKKYVKTRKLSATEKFSYDQKIQVCQLSKLYQVTKCQFTGYVSNKDIMIYRKNRKVFFVLIIGHSFGKYYERRYYCNQDEKLIQQLDREGKSENDLNINNIEINTDLNKNIKVVLSTIFDEIKREFN